MKFHITLPPANLKNSAVSCVLFSFFTSFFCFNIYLRRVHLESVASMKGTITTLREEFMAVETSLPRPLGESLPLVTTLQSLKAQNMTNCTAFPGRYEPTTHYRQSTKLPDWMKDYFDWHRRQTANINRCNFLEYNYLITRCSYEENKCGGVADRLKSLPFYIAAAAFSQRIFLIRWERPTKLEKFLLPNEINWSVPDWMYGELDNFSRDHPQVKWRPTAKMVMKGIKRYKNNAVIESIIQDFYGGSSQYYRLDSEMDENKTVDHEYIAKVKDFAGWRDYEKIFRDMFFTLFEPTPAIAKLVRDKMKVANLVPNAFAASHYRAFYAVEHKKNVVTDFELTSKTRNALNCASRMQPGEPIFFASDSHTAVQFAHNMTETHNRTIITFDNKREAIHFDKRFQWKSKNVSDFYPSFVDILIMAEAKCMSLGVGGFGKFANMISRDPSCVIRHDSEKRKHIQRCQWHDSKEDLVRYSANDW